MEVSVADVAGAVSIVIGVLLALAAVYVEVRLRRPFRNLAARPMRWLYACTSVPFYGGRTAIGVSGTVVSAPVLHAPVTQQPCVAWKVSLLRDDSDDHIDAWTGVWGTQRVQDLEIAYDLRWDYDGHMPPPDRPEFVPSPGTVAIDGGRIEVGSTSSFGSVGPRSVEVDEATRPLLADAGVPEDLRQQVAGDSRRYRLVEGALSAGAFVRCFQEDPDARFTLLAGSTEEQSASMGSCAVAMLVATALLALLVGLALLGGGSASASSP